MKEILDHNVIIDAAVVIDETFHRVQNRFVSCNAGLNTARLGLSTLAALYLHEGVEKVVINDRAFLDKLREKKEALANFPKQ